MFQLHILIHTHGHDIRELFYFYFYFFNPFNVDKKNNYVSLVSCYLLRAQILVWFHYVFFFFCLKCMSTKLNVCVYAFILKVISVNKIQMKNYPTNTVNS